MQQLSILLVEDNPSDAKLIEILLCSIQSWEIITQTVQRMAEARTALQAEAFDMLLLDLSLPDSDTAATMDAIPGLCKELPIIVLTGLEDEATGVRAIEAGAQDYLTKQDLKTDILQRVIRYALARQQLLITQREKARLEADLRKEQEHHALKSQFINFVSHDLRNPLSVINVAIKTLLTHRDKMTEEQMLRRFHHIEESVGRMMVLIDQVLTIGQTDAARIELDIRPCNLVDLCQEVIKEQKRAHPERNLWFVLDGRNDITARVDKHLMGRTISNVVGNALKYSDAPSEVQVMLETDNADCVLTVIDKGLGIPPEAIDDLYVPFYRAENGHRRGGSGLGLSIVKQIVDAHGGSIDIQSKLNVGTKVILRFPLGVALQQSPPRPTPKAQ